MGDIRLYRDSINIALISVKSALRLEQQDMLWTNNTETLLEVEKMLSKRIAEVDQIILEANLAKCPEIKKILKELELLPP